jgi:hypothetical protein
MIRLTVHLVAEQGMSDMLEVHPYLVGSTVQRLAPDQAQGNTV